MKYPARSALVLIITAVVTLSSYDIARSHCEIPCGIYGDTTRITLLYEDIDTVEKSMKEIQSRAGTDATDFNQRVRWIRNKEDHADKIQHVVTQYFMTQRVKPKAEGDKGRAKYIAQLTSLHEMMIHAMKAKQTLDAGHCKKLRQLVSQFSGEYFSGSDLEHIRKEHGGAEKHDEHKGHGHD